MPVQELFLYLVSRTGNETASAHLAGASTAQLAHWKQAEDFCAELDKAHHQAGEWLQYHAWQRAVIGVQVPYFFKGEIAGFRRHYSDRLLVWLQKQADCLSLMAGLSVQTDAGSSNPHSQIRWNSSDMPAYQAR